MGFQEKDKLRLRAPLFPAAVRSVRMGRIERAFKARRLDSDGVRVFYSAF